MKVIMRIQKSCKMAIIDHGLSLDLNKINYLAQL